MVIQYCTGSILHTWHNVAFPPASMQAVYIWPWTNYLTFMSLGPNMQSKGSVLPSSTHDAWIGLALRLTTRHILPFRHKCQETGLERGPIKRPLSKQSMACLWLAEGN